MPRAGSLSLLLKGDVSSYSSSGVTDNSTHVFKIDLTGDADNDTPGEAVVGIGAVSNAPATITIGQGFPGIVAGNQMTILRSNLTFSASPLGLSVGRTKTPTDDLARLTFTADQAGPVAVNSVRVTFAGTAPSASSTSFIDGVNLIDEAGNQMGFGNVSISCTGINICYKIFNLLGVGTSTGQAIFPGAPRTWTLRVDSTRTAPGQINVAQTLTATVNALGDIRYTDALDAAAVSGISLSPRTAVPIPLNSVSYASGALAPNSQD